MHIETTSLLRDSYHHSRKLFSVVQFYSFILFHLFNRIYCSLDIYFFSSYFCFIVFILLYVLTFVGKKKPIHSPYLLFVRNFSASVWWMINFKASTHGRTRVLATTIYSEERLMFGNIWSSTFLTSRLL
jgi:hypothetical protein